MTQQRGKLAIRRRDVLPPRVSDAEYTAVIERLEMSPAHGKKLKATVSLRSPDHAFGASLVLWFNLNPDGTFGAFSKLAGVLRAIAAYYNVAEDQIQPEVLLEFHYRVRTRTVTKRRNAQKRWVPLPEHDWYSVVDEIVRVRGKRSELPPECRLPKEQS